MHGVGLRKGDRECVPALYMERLYTFFGKREVGSEPLKQSFEDGMHAGWDLVRPAWQHLALATEVGRYKQAITSGYTSHPKFNYFAMLILLGRSNDHPGTLLAALATNRPH